MSSTACLLHSHGTNNSTAHVLQSTATIKQAMAFGIPDELLGVLMPIVTYWLYSGIYVLLDPYLDRYRLHTKEEEQTKNIATKLEVVKGILLAQAVQIIFFLSVFMLKGDSTGPAMQPPLQVVIAQFSLAMFILDTWIYFSHRLMHTKFLYKHIHSQHHRLIVSYPYGAQFNHPLEEFINATIGPFVALLITGMTPRTAAFFFTFASVKGLEDHSGFYIPWNPFHRLFENNCLFHDVHHQLYGLKYNYATPFFNIWDRVLGTYLPFEVKTRKGGDGYEVFPLKNQ